MQNKQWILNSFPMGEIKDNDLIFKLAPKIVEGVDKLRKWSDSL